MKQPWEMTYEEYKSIYGKRPKGTPDDPYYDQFKRLGARLLKIGDKIIYTNGHGVAVYKALLEDQPVPKHNIEKYSYIIDAMQRMRRAEMGSREGEVRL